jgi:undecaprenyl-diphosphatase
VAWTSELQGKLPGVKPVWLVAAVALAAFLVWRRRKLEHTVLGAGVIAVVALAIYSTGLVHLPQLDKVLEDLGKALGPWTYLLVALLAFFEAAAFLGLILPGETGVIVGGVVAGQGQIDIVALIAVAWGFAVLGDLTGYGLGRRLGRPFLLHHGPRFGLTEERIHSVERFFDKHGGKAVFIGRFVGLVRSMSPFLAGSSKMPLRRFVPYDVLGAGIQSSLLCIVGYVFWQSLDQVLAIVKKGALALSTVIVLLVAIVTVVRWLRVPEHRERVSAWLDAHRANPAVRLLLALDRHVRRPARFLRDRLTPGDLGLELTTLLALALVGGYVFFGYLAVLHGRALTPGDRRGQAWSDSLRTDWLDDAARAVSHLGSPWVTGVLVALVAAVLVWRGRALEGGALAGGFVLILLGVLLVGDSVARPAPAAGVTDASYPDAHAAYAISWVGAAIALRRAFAHVAAVATLVTVGVVVAVLTGITAVYLGEDWFSDVAGGLGLGVLGFALAGMVAMALEKRSTDRLMYGSTMEGSHQR